MSDEQVVSSAPAGRQPSRTMSGGWKLLLGALTFWPPVYIVLFMSFGFIMVAVSPEGESSGVPLAFTVLFTVHLLTMLEMMLLTIYYAVNVYREDALQGDRKILWMVIVLLGGFIGQAVYYVLWIVKRSPSVLGSNHPAASPIPDTPGPDARI